jgi:hypothetical protein
MVSDQDRLDAARAVRDEWLRVRDTTETQSPPVKTSAEIYGEARVIERWDG